MSAAESSGTGQVPDGPAGAPGADEEVAQLRAERDAAVTALNKEGRRRTRRTRVRKVSAAVLVVVFAILLPVTITATWAHRTVVNTDAYVATVTPIAASPAVQAAVSTEITNEIYAALNPQQTIANALPPKAAKLAGPLSNGVKGYLQEGINKIIASPKFQQLWVTANQFAHAQLITVLNGDSKALQTTNGQVVLNLVPLLNEVLKDVQARASALLGKNVTLPTISGNTVPAAACQKISTAIGRPLPSTCGQIPLFPASTLANAQHAYRAFNRLVLALLILTPLVFIGALWTSPRRRRTLLQLTVGGMLGLIVIRRAMFWLQSDLIGKAKPANHAALTVITGQVLHGLFTVTEWFLIGGLILAVLTLLSGPYRWAVALRSGVRRAAQAVADLGSALLGHATSDTTVTWIRRHLDLLRIGGAVIAALALLIFSVNWVGFLIIAALLALYEYGLHRLRQPQPAAEPSAHQRPATARTSRPQPGCQRRRWHRLGPQAPVVGPAPKRRQGITGTHPAKAHGRIHPGRPEMIPGSGFTTGSGAFGPQETPGHPASAQPAERLRAKPGRPIPPSGWCC